MYFCSDIKWWPRSLCICWSSGSVYSVQERRVCVYGDQDGQYTVTIQPCLLLLPPLWPTGPPPPQHFLLPRALTSRTAPNDHSCKLLLHKLLLVVFLLLLLTLAVKENKDSPLFQCPTHSWFPQYSSLPESPQLAVDIPPIPLSTAPLPL